jgi:hypothetical protein
MVMVQYIAMMGGVISTIMIAWQIHRSNRSGIKVPVRNDEPPYFRRSRNDRR